MNAETYKFDTHVSTLGNDLEIEFQEIKIIAKLFRVRIGEWSDKVRLT
jgi:hypothetical protein